MKDIFETLEKNKFNYSDIRENSIISLLNKDEFDMNVIIGFRGRQEFLEPLIKSFQRAFSYHSSKYGSKTFCFTFVEHDVEPKCRSIIEGRFNYIWSPGNVSELYSRSFAYNFGVKYSNKSKYYLLHDLDILVKENFFEELYENLGESKCMQTYGKRRVLYMSQSLTPQVISGEIDFNVFDENTPEVSLPMFAGKPALGSKGGSIVVERDFYYEIGGFDPEIFWGYAAEDQMFWDKALTKLGEVQYADNPPIDMFHMWHPPAFGSNPSVMEMENYMLQFRGLNKKERNRYIDNQKKTLNDE